MRGPEPERSALRGPMAGRRRLPVRLNVTVQLSDDARAALRPGEVLVLDWLAARRCGPPLGQVVIHPVDRRALPGRSRFGPLGADGPVAVLAHRRLLEHLAGRTVRMAYRAWGLRRAGIHTVWLDPRVWARYARLLAGGQRPYRPGRDTLQLGVTSWWTPPDWSPARPQRADDRPPVAVLLAEPGRAANR